MMRSWLRSLRPALPVLVVAVLLLELVLLLPHLPGLRSALSAASLLLVLAAYVPALLAFLFFSLVQHRFLVESGVRAPLSQVFSSVAAGNAITLSFPAGALLGAAYLYRRLRFLGASSFSAAWTLTSSGVLLSFALALLALSGTFLLGAQISVPLLPIGSLVLLVLLVLLVRLLLRDPSRLLSLLPVRLRRPALRSVLESLSGVRLSAGTLSLALVFALLKWCCELLVLSLALLSLGAGPLPLGALVLVYCAGAASASLPLTPAGIGVVETALTVALVSASLPFAVAFPAVLVYRLVSLSAAYGCGWICFLWLRRVL